MPNQVLSIQFIFRAKIGRRYPYNFNLVVSENYNGVMV